ncbi:MAG: acetylornithine transaminase [Nocardioidaceae bacterium]|nr:acetylornithine transaminase [Nocardioidaceae bacterium]
MSGVAWTERYQAAVMNTFGPPKRVLVRGKGSYVWDADDNCYLDLLGGIAVNAIGQAHPAVVAAVTDQLGRLGHVSNFFATEPQVRLAEKLLDLVGRPGRVFFTNSGTEANEAAFKLSRRTGRTEIVAATGSFHGRTMGALSLTSKAAYREPFAPLPGDVAFCPYGDADALRTMVSPATAAIVLESIQGEAGAIDPPDGYLAAARQVADDAGALLWMDEVQSGMGRTGDWFGYCSAGIVPDVVTLAKGLGGGIPIGACVALGGASDLLRPGDHGSTFGGNPVATAAALAVIDVIESEGLLANARVVGEHLRAGLVDHHLVADLSGRGLLIGIGLRADVGAEVVAQALQHGLITNNTGPDRLRLVPPLTLTADEADRGIELLRAAMDTATMEERS